MINKETKQNINISNYLGMSQDEANFEQMIRIQSTPSGAIICLRRLPLVAACSTATHLFRIRNEIQWVLCRITSSFNLNEEKKKELK